MVFSSTIFLFLFLPVVLIIYYLLPKIKYKNVFLLIASLVFYGYGEHKFVFIMILSIIINYFLGFIVEYAKKYSLIYRRISLLLVVLVNVALLFYYKYYDFFIENVNSVFGLELPLKHIVLPIGISFFTFQIMSYLFDLYLNKVKLQKNPLKLGLYIALFPQLIAGPIVRYIDIAEQIDNRTLSVDYFAEGLKRFIIGLGKKIIIANSFASVADSIFAMSPNEMSVMLAWAGAIAYTLQIYFDFSGYSDMAIGLGYMLGFRFLENFNYPYIAKSVQDFWRRWHISLSSWFRDYIYIPLGGNRTGNVYVNLLIVFFVTGLWHGASWNFVLWGMSYGLFLMIERLLKNSKLKNIKIPYIVTWFYTMIVVIIGWVMFRASDMTYAYNYIKVMFGIGNNGIIEPLMIKYMNEYLIIFIIAVFLSTPLVKNINNLIEKYSLKSSYIIQYIFLVIIFWISIIYTVTSTYNPFIYFNF